MFNLQKKQDEELEPSVNGLESPKVILTIETWITEEDNKEIFTITNYTSFAYENLEKRGGGLTIKIDPE